MYKPFYSAISGTPTLTFDPQRGQKDVVFTGCCCVVSSFFDCMLAANRTYLGKLETMCSVERGSHTFMPALRFESGRPFAGSIKRLPTHIILISHKCAEGTEYPHRTLRDTDVAYP